MKNVCVFIASLFLIASVAVALTSCGDRSQPSIVSSNDAAVQETKAHYEQWSAYAGNSDSSQFSSLDQINKNNISQLQIAWHFPTGHGKLRASPIIVDRVMYVTANGGIAALDAATGEQKWFAPNTISAPLRGLSYWENENRSERRLFFSKGHKLLALDAQTGTLIASFGNKGGVDLRKGLGRDPTSIMQIASLTPGRIFENLIIVGSAVGDESYEAAPGDIRAYDVRTGDLVWIFHTIPHPGEAGYETWPPEAWKSVGGANAWSALSIDEQRGIAYIPTGAPSYHFYGANRQGDNLFANSLIALDARTGKRLWHFQAVHHDLWDYDLAMAPKLLTVERGGKKIDAVAIATKQGFLFVFDRVSGEPIFSIEERPVPPSDMPGERASLTQPFPLQIPSFANRALSENELNTFADEQEREALKKRIQMARNEGLFTPPSVNGSVSVPGSRGGAQFGNGAVVPDAGLFYLAVIESPTIPKLEPKRRVNTEHSIALPVSEVFSANCAMCHGAGGEGQRPLFPAISGVSQRLSLDQFQAVIKQGRGRMPAFPDISDVQIEELMGYVDKLKVLVPDISSPTVSETATEEGKRYWSGYHHFYSKEGFLLGPTPWSRLLAYDLNQGKILWQKPYGDVIQLAKKGITGTGSLFPSSSLVVTAGGLLFSTTNDRKIRAWDRDTGEVLWSADLPADPGGIPAVYQIDGRQYIVATATYGDAVSGQDYNENAYVAFALPKHDTKASKQGVSPHE